ncbi:MAG: mechanosensitive ion channel [Chloroflexi bacterium]|nr:mechanosensitive ion channel [Chloroflexota bacterium]
MNDWLAVHWLDVLVPFSVLFASLVVLLWVRRRIAHWLDHWARRTRWPGDDILYHAARWPSLLWIALISIYLGLETSTLPGSWHMPATRSLWTVFMFSLAYSFVGVSSGLLRLYGDRLHIPAHVTRGVSVAVSVLVLFVAVLTAMDLWGAPIGPLLLAMGLMAIAVGVALRDILPGLLEALHINTTGYIKAGDYIKLETGEQGYVLDVGWTNTRVKALDESIVMVPNVKLARTTVVNYGRPLKKAIKPFRFSSRTHLKELTGLKAKDLYELADMLKKVPEAVVYYHTHHFLEEHHYLSPEPPNDFAVWVTDVLGDEVLGERLAAVDTFEFPTLGTLRERLGGIVEEHLAQPCEHRHATEGREFYFIKSVSFITPTPYVAYDLRELTEALRKLPVGSLYFHVFESRLRLGRSRNDFSAWIGDELGEQQLAEQMAHLDPYQYTLEELRSQLIRLIEKRIK